MKHLIALSIALGLAFGIVALTAEDRKITSTGSKKTVAKKIAPKDDKTKKGNGGIATPNPNIPK